MDGLESARTHLSCECPSWARKSEWRSKKSALDAGDAASAGALLRTAEVDVNTAAALDVLLSLRYSVPRAADADKNAAADDT